MGTEGDMFFKRFPGLVPLKPWGESLFRSFFKARSTAAGLIERSFVLMTGVL
jgi:hypothetical protein